MVQIRILFFSDLITGILLHKKFIDPLTHKASESRLGKLDLSAIALATAEEADWRGLNARLIFTMLINLIIPSGLFCYGLPKINLGASSFLDGGPLRQIPGYYFQIISQDYDTRDFKGPEGQSLCGRNCPHFNEWANAMQLIYLSQTNVMGLGSFGWDITLPIICYSKIDPNFLGITSNGGGIGDLAMGMYVQAHPIYHGDRPVYVHRLEFVASFPTGTDKRPEFDINPGNGVFYMNPYWAATMYFTPRFQLRGDYTICGYQSIIKLILRQVMRFMLILFWNMRSDLVFI